ncbi:insulinase family protein [Couchioplanes azureus]|uniref:insulinase family protein n=1 Tax=Couchioplanes caeruleus TaxID=56438 RepID=UPI00166F9E7B|nr:insulinase family protein [Couchioplanes caeruleus]GGQ68029.1 hypothetical protein GCM10010166_42540 [Couchioplanes caeruleus subsp. azureus]
MNPTAEPVHRFRRCDGLRVDLEVLPWAHSLGATLVVGCGSRDDPPGREGTAHLAEHLQVLADPAGGTGGVPLLAVTDVDRTLFQGVGDPGDAGMLIRRLLDIGEGRCRPAGPDVFEGERHAVLLETRRMDHQPLLRLGPLLAAAAADEAGLDAIGRTTTDSVRRVAAADVAELIARGYSAADARLFLAGPPSVIGDVETVLGRCAPAVPSPDTARPAAVARRPADDAEPSRLPGLGALVAVTLLRPRNTPSLALDALLDDHGPIAGPVIAQGWRPLGRATVEGRTQRVDIVVWRAGGTPATLDRRLARMAAGDWRAEVVAAANRLRARRAVAREWRLATPLGRTGDAARQVVLPGPGSDVHRLALWTVADGAPQRLAEHALRAVPQ